MLLTREERAYLAGFVDGEGCFSSGLKQGKYYRPRIGITQKDPEYLIWLRTKLEFGNLWQVRGSNGSMHWRFVVNKPPLIITFIELVYPFLRLKKPQADVMMRMVAKDPLKGEEEHMELKRLKHE